MTTVTCQGEPMRLLVLGGTAMLGAEIARQALAQGIEVTCAARGSSPVPKGACLVQVDRDISDALTPLQGQVWDSVIDLTRQPGHARRAVRDIDATHWVFISSMNVYAHFNRPEQSEAAQLLEPLATDVLTDPSQYGPVKVACEQAVQTGHDSWTIIRSGLIGGPDDDTSRSGYYPWRFAHPTGPDVLVPPDLSFPVALIDVRDLAAWTVDCATNRLRGVYNVAGPTTTLAHLLDTARTVAGSTAIPRPVPAHALKAAGISEWMGTPALPLWLDDPDWRWFCTADTTAARRHGLTVRPLDQTLAAALAYEEHHTGGPATGLTDEQERTLRNTLDDPS